MVAGAVRDMAQYKDTSIQRLCRDRDKDSTTIKPNDSEPRTGAEKIARVDGVLFLSLLFVLHPHAHPREDIRDALSLFSSLSIALPCLVFGPTSFVFTYFM